MIQRHHASLDGFFWWGARRATSAGRSRSRHFCLESLESRRLLAAISEFPVPSGPYSAPEQIAVGPDGNLWFTEYSAGQIGMINATTHNFTEIPLSPNAQAPRHHSRAGWQHLVHRVRHQPDRNDQPDDPSGHRIPPAANPQRRTL